MIKARLPGLFTPTRSLVKESQTTNQEREYARKLGYLAAIDIFRDLTPDDMAHLDRVTRMSTVERGQMVYVPGRTGEMLFLLKKGHVQLYRLSNDGRKLVISVLGPETFFGDMAILGQDMVSTFAEAIEDSTVCVMTRDDVEALILRKPTVALRLLDVLGRRLIEAESRLEEVTFKRVPTRLAGLLVRLATDEKSDHVQLSHQELAEMLGVYRETVTNALTGLRDAGAVELGRRRITIRDWEKLRRLANE